MSKLTVLKGVIDALKESCQSDEDLRGIVKRIRPEISSDAVRKRVSRYLTELRRLGVVIECGGKYCWYVYYNDFKDREDYEAKLNHSNKMIPALRQIAGVTLATHAFGPEEYVDANLRILGKGAEDHLRAGYPDVWRLLIEYREVKEKVKQRRNMFYSALMDKMRKKFEKETIVEPIKESRYQSFIGSNIPLLICNRIQYGSPSRPYLDDDKIWVDGRLVAKGKSLFKKVKDFIEGETKDEVNINVVEHIEKIQNKATEIGRELEEEIRKLILRIESGGPLLGRCEICQIYFSITKKK